MQEETAMHLAAGTLASEYTAGGTVSAGDDEMVLMLLLQAEAGTDAGDIVSVYNVFSTT